MTQSSPLIRALFEGPLDLIGDVHGELPTLKALMAELGYGEEGEHEEGRRLVFVGDLVDRGLDSPGVVELVSGLVAAGRAQCILGNHELNLLRRKKKEGSRWFTGETVEFDGDKLAMRQRPLDSEDQRRSMLEFFASLPIGLEREDLRVVHASWDERAAECARQATSILELFEEEEVRVREEVAALGLEARIEVEEADLKRRGLNRMKKTTERFPFCEARGEKAVLEQGNAVRLLTSGPQSLVPNEEPFFVGGMWRMSKRDRWWEDYAGQAVVVVGHYWRSKRTSGGMATKPGEPDPFEGIEPIVGLGPRCKVRVIDYSLGLGYKRRAGVEIEPSLAALRWPEDELVFQDLVETGS
jgi:hypothetical protein